MVLTLGLLSPGPDFLLVLKNSAGTRRGYAYGTVAGIATGLAVQMLVISLGLVAAPPALLRGVQLGGAAFLALIGFRALRGVSTPGPGAAVEFRPGLRNGYTEGLVCNLTNPKAFLFFVSLFAQTLKPDTAAFWRILLPVAVVAHGAIAWSLVAAAVQSPPVARRLVRAQQWLPRMFGAVLILVAAAVLARAWRA